MTDHLIILQLLIFLILSPTLIFSKYKKVTIFFVGLILFSGLLIGLKLYQTWYDIGKINYVMGNWQSFIGIMLSPDKLSMVTNLFTMAFAFIAFIFCFKLIQDNLSEQRLTIFLIIFLLNILGLLGMQMTGDIFNLYVFLEISSLTTYTLLSIGEQPKSDVHSFNYLVIGSIAATFILIGIGYLYSLTGALSMDDLHGRLLQIGNNKSVQIGVMFIFIGLIIKSGLFPFHQWMISSYSHSNILISSFFVSCATKIFICILIKLIYKVFSVPGLLDSIYLFKALKLFGYFSIFFASIQLYVNDNIKKMLLYSSLYNLGYMSLLIGLNHVDSLSIVFVTMFGHSFSKMLAFLCSYRIEQLTKLGQPKIHNAHGLFYHEPITAISFTISLFSLVGIPFTIGFTYKWNIILQLIQKSEFLGLTFVIFSGLVGLIKFSKIIVKMFVKEKDVNNYKFSGILPYNQKAILKILSIFIIASFFYSKNIMSFTKEISKFIMEDYAVVISK